jgi:hypothetical protein
VVDNFVINNSLACEFSQAFDINNYQMGDVIINYSIAVTRENSVHPEQKMEVLFSLSASSIKFE